MKKWRVSNNYRLSDAELIAGVILLFIVALALSFVGCAFLLWLISLCFGWSFQWHYALGVWLIFLMFNIMMGGVNIRIRKD